GTEPSPARYPREIIRNFFVTSVTDCLTANSLQAGRFQQTASSRPRSSAPPVRRPFTFRSPSVTILQSGHSDQGFSISDQPRRLSPGKPRRSTRCGVPRDARGRPRLPRGRAGRNVVSRRTTASADNRTDNSTPIPSARGPPARAAGSALLECDSDHHVPYRGTDSAMPDTRLLTFRRTTLREGVSLAVAAAAVLAVATSSAISVADDRPTSRITMVAEQAPLTEDGTAGAETAAPVADIAPLPAPQELAEALAKPAPKVYENKDRKSVV